MIKVAIYPVVAGAVNKSPYMFDPRQEYNALIYLSYGDTVKLLSFKIGIKDDLHRDSSEVVILEGARYRYPNQRVYSDEYMKEVKAFLKTEIRNRVNEQRQQDNLFSVEEIAHLGPDRMERHRIQLDKELSHWKNVSMNLEGTDRTRAFGRQMALLVQGQLNHYDTFIGKQNRYSPLTVTSHYWRD